MNTRAKNLIIQLEEKRKDLTHFEFIELISVYIDSECYDLALLEEDNFSNCYEEDSFDYSYECIFELNLYRKLQKKLPPKGIKTKVHKI